MLVGLVRPLLVAPSGWLGIRVARSPAGCAAGVGWDGVHGDDVGGVALDEQGVDPAAFVVPVNVFDPEAVADDVAVGVARGDPY